MLLSLWDPIRWWELHRPPEWLPGSLVGLSPSSPETPLSSLKTTGTTLLLGMPGSRQGVALEMFLS